MPHSSSDCTHGHSARRAAGALTTRGVLASGKRFASQPQQSAPAPVKRSTQARVFAPDLQPAPLFRRPAPQLSPKGSRSSDPEPNYRNFDFVVVGSGIAGLTYALKVAQHGSVAVITKEDLEDGCTQYAQGGVCAVLDPLDSVESHMYDTMVAGSFLNDVRCATAVLCWWLPMRALVQFMASMISAGQSAAVQRHANMLCANELSA